MQTINEVQDSNRNNCLQNISYKNVAHGGSEEYNMSEYDGNKDVSKEGPLGCKDGAPSV